MKSKIPTPVVVISVVLLLAVAGFFISRAGAATAEFEAPQTGKTIPKYVWDGMTPDMQAKMKAEGYSPGDVKPEAKGAPAGAPNVAPR